MTLVCAVKLGTVPCVLGDMLITHGPGTGDHSYNAVRGEFIKAGSTERRRSGAYRKVVKFGENLVMGYTGKVDAAKILLDDFAGRFSGRAATIETLRRLSNS